MSPKVQGLRLLMDIQAHSHYTYSYTHRVGELSELTCPLLHTRPKPGILGGNLNPADMVLHLRASLEEKVDVVEKLISRQTKVL